MKLKLTTLVVGNVELTKRRYLHNNTTASTPTATSTANLIIITTAATATKAKTTTVKCTPTATIITTDATATNKPKGVKGENFGQYINCIKINQNTLCHIGCQKAMSVKLQDLLMGLI